MPRPVTGSTPGGWSLRYRLLGVVVLVTVCIGSALVSLVVVGAEREQHAEAVRVARFFGLSIDGTLRAAMQTGNRDVLQGAVDSLGQQTKVMNLAVLDATGETVMRGGAPAPWREAVDRLVTQARTTGTISSAQVADTAHAVVSPVRGGPGCARCHGPKDTLGFIVATVSTAAEQRRILALRNRLLWGGLLLLGIVCLVITVGVVRWVERPVAKLTALVDKLRSEDPDAAAHAGTRDEIARLSASFQSMAAQVAEKTEALVLAERDVARSQRLASIGLLAAGIAHEIGSPLSTILLQASFWEEQGEGPRRSAAAVVARAAERVAVLQRELLTFDRREALHIARCDLVALVRGCLGMTEHPGLQCRLDSAEEQLIIAADRTLLGRAIGNVLANAAQAMQGQGTLTVAIRRLDDNCVEVAIQDAGPGIPPEDLDSVFEPFVTRKQGSGGSGLGLAISREIIARHGGEIAAETTPTGACFRLLLPLDLKDQADGHHPDC